MFGEYAPNSVAVFERPASSNFSILCLGTCFNISQVLLKTKHDCNQAGYISNAIMYNLAKIAVLYLGTCTFFQDLTWKVLLYTLLCNLLYNCILKKTARVYLKKYLKIELPADG